MPRLLIRSPEGKEWEILIRGEAFVGRRSTCEVPLADLKVSRQHARFFREGERWRLLDLGSRNGFKANGDVKTAHDLLDGDTLEFGDHQIRFVLADESPSNDPERIPPNTRFGGFTLQERLAGWPLGPVYNAKGPDGSPAWVVVLSPAPSGASTGPDRRLDEALASARLHHPGIAPILEARREGEFSYLAMAAVPGRMLIDFLEAKGKRPVEQGLGWCQSLGEALSFAHRQGVAHPYLSPANIWIPDRGPPLMLGYGIKCPRSAEVPALLPYIAPEIREGRAADARADLFSLGAIFARAVSDDLRYFRVEPGVPLPLDEELRRLGPAFAGLTRDAHAWVLRMVAKDPARRFQRITECLLGPVEAELSSVGLSGADSNLGLSQILQQDAVAAAQREYLQGIPSESAAAPLPPAAPPAAPAPRPARAAPAPAPPPEPEEQEQEEGEGEGEASEEAPPVPIPWNVIARGALWASLVLLALLLLWKIPSFVQKEPEKVRETSASEADDAAFRAARKLEDDGAHEKAHKAYQDYLDLYPLGAHAKEAVQRGKRIEEVFKSKKMEEEAQAALRRGLDYREKYPDDLAGARRYLEDIISTYPGTRAAADAKTQLENLNLDETGRQRTKEAEEADKAVEQAEALLAKGAFEPARVRFEEIRKRYQAGTRWNRRAQEGLLKAAEGAEKLFLQFETPVKKFLSRDNPTTLDLIQARGLLAAGVPLLQTHAGPAWAAKAQERLAEVDDRLSRKFRRDFSSTLKSALASNHPDAIERLRRLDQEFKSVANFGAIILDARSRIQRLQALHRESIARIQKQGPRPFEGPLLGVPTGRITSADDLGIELSPAGGTAVRVPWRLIAPAELERVYGFLVPVSEAAWADAREALRWIRDEADKTK